jgi:hypothetical protein
MQIRDKAYTCLLGCILAYPKNKNSAHLPLEKEYRANVGNDTCLMGVIDNAVYIFVAGSNDYEDWKENISLDFNNDLMGRIYSYLMINQLRHKDIYISGHSRGGKIAQDLAYEMKKNDFKIKAVYTFASTKIENPKKKNIFPHFRYINNRDPVPNYPFLIQRIFSRRNWGHNGVLIQLDKPSFLSRWMNVSGAIKYHSIWSYKKAFEAYYSRG